LAILECLLFLVTIYKTSF